jgi:predicted dinucleotide-binding enzyme
MKLAILGSGNMGAALGRLLAAAGHAVTFSYSRDPKKRAALARRSGPRARSASPAEAVRGADVVVLAVHWRLVPEVLRLAGPLRGKTLIDVTNPMTPADDALAVGLRVSGGELVARRARGARVVKAFNTVPAELLRAGPGVLDATPDVCYCGDDAQAKRVVARLIRQIGFDPVDCGALTVARYLEPLALLVAELAYNQGHRPEVGVRFLRRGAKRRR